MKMMVVALLMVFGGTAQATDYNNMSGTLLLTSSPTIFTVLGTQCAVGDDCQFKLVIERAQDDAAAFIGSNGAVRGAQLEHALLVIRKSNPELKASDMDLANKILAEAN
jgi:uncharacterized protein (TIGR02448 family)